LSGVIHGGRGGTGYGGHGALAAGYFEVCNLVRVKSCDSQDLI